MPVLSLKQGHVRIRNDNGTEITATWAGAEDAQALISPGAGFRARLQAYCVGGPSSVQPTLEFALNNSGNWNTVTSTSAIQLNTSLNFADHDATTNQLTNNGTFVAGSMQNNDLTALSIKLADGQCTEFEWALRMATSLEQPNTVQLRMVPLVFYDNYADIGVKAGSVDGSTDSVRISTTMLGIGPTVPKNVILG